MHLFYFTNLLPSSSHCKFHDSQLQLLNCNMYKWARKCIDAIYYPENPLSIKSIIRIVYRASISLQLPRSLKQTVCMVDRLCFRGQMQTQLNSIIANVTPSHPPVSGIAGSYVNDSNFHRPFRRLDYNEPAIQIHRCNCRLPHLI